MTSADVRPITAARPDFTLADRLRKAREFAGLEQNELAALTHISRNTIGNYEGGKVRPKMSYLMLWAQVCGVDLDWLCGDDVRPTVTRQYLPSHTAPVVSIWTAPSKRSSPAAFIPSQQTG